MYTSGVAGMAPAGWSPVRAKRVSLRGAAGIGSRVHLACWAVSASSVIGLLLGPRVCWAFVGLGWLSPGA